MTKGKQNMGHRILLDKYYIQYKSLLNVRIVAMLHLARGARSAPRCEFQLKGRLPAATACFSQNKYVL